MKKWRAWRDSNPRHPVPKTGALSTELQAQMDTTEIIPDKRGGDNGAVVWVGRGGVSGGI